MSEKLRIINYIGGKEWKKEDLKRYILANTLFFKLWKWEDFELNRILSPKQLKEIEDETIILFELKHWEVSETDEVEYKIIGKDNELNFISITL